MATTALPGDFDLLEEGAADARRIPALRNPTPPDVTALHLAARFGDLKLCRQALEEGADIEACTAHGHTPLHEACIAGSPHLVDLLLAAGADPDARDELGRTPLHYAVRQVVAEQIVTELVLAEADFDAQDSTGWTALHSAAACGQAGAIRVLVGFGADPSLETIAGLKAVDFARRHDDHQQMSVLLEFAGEDLSPSP